MGSESTDVTGVTRAYEPMAAMKPVANLDAARIVWADGLATEDRKSPPPRRLAIVSSEVENGLK